jgi:hypothetical protein
MHNKSSINQLCRALSLQRGYTLCLTEDTVPQVAMESDGAVTQLTVTVPASRCLAAYKTTIAHLRENYEVPGFRNVDKAPEHLLIKAAGGVEQFTYAVVESLIGTTLPEVRPTEIKQNKNSNSESLCSLADQHALQQCWHGSCVCTYLRASSISHCKCNSTAAAAADTSSCGRPALAVCTTLCVAT